MYTETIIFGGLSRLIMRKMICDCCGKEIDTSYQEDWDVRPKAKLRIYDEIVIKNNGLNRDLCALEYDLCDFCAQKVVDCIKFNKDVAKSV